MSYARQAPMSASWKGQPLYYKGRDGKLHVWEIWAEKNTVVTAYGIVDGKMQSSRRLCSSKGKGKAKTTPEEQAIKEAKAKHKHNLDRKYSDNPEKASLPLELPMLADSFFNKEFKITSKGNKLIAGAFDIQPKIDGVRALARWQGNELVLVSRSGKPFKGLEHITGHLKQVLPRDWELDGELYVHGVPLQTLNSWIPKENAKKLKPERLRLEYWVFDVPVVNGDETLSWFNRRWYLKPTNGDLPQLMSKGVHPHLKIVPFKECPSMEEFDQFEKKILSKGFEGVMLRGHQGLYEYGRRSPLLLKAKRFNDEEFTIASYRDGDGKFAGAVVFRCWKKGCEGEYPTDENSFEVVPRGSMDAKRAMYQHGEEYIGQKLTVRFQKYTEDNKPFLPVGIPNAAFVRHAFDQP